MSKRRFRPGDRVRAADIQGIEDAARRNRPVPSSGMLLKSGPDGVTQTPITVPASAGTGGSQAWAKLVLDGGGGLYSWWPATPAGPPDFWLDFPGGGGSYSGTRPAVEANLCAGLPIPSYVPITYDGAGRPRFQMELCVSGG